MQSSDFLQDVFEKAALSPDELALVLSKFKRVSFNKNSFLLRDGEIEKSYWFIESGFIRSFVLDTDGNDITFNLYAKGDVVIDYASFFFFSPTRENIQALTDCMCWQIDFEDFQVLFHSILNFREQQRALLVGSYFALKEHSISIIADQAKDRYLRFLKEKPHIVQNVALKYIATYLGITDTSLSRIRKEIINE